ncbi:MAG: glycosyl transferase, family 2, partial [Solirubrobacteraceae bacterium]|nr:glycosyl transferase, family 2 [Solirubrobacteraceae bacterium]
LEPVVAGEADMVIGSRILGATETDDAFRQTGVHVFGALVRLLTGSSVTDTSSGFRAMRLELTQTVRQEQVQYQTSELLIGALLQGYRVVERPIRMRKRLAGESKKGHNVLYGLRYAGVILQTWQRDRAASTLPPRERGPIARFAIALRAARFAIAVAFVAVMAILAARNVSLRGVSWPWLAPGLALCVVWWILLARGWAILVGGRAALDDIGTWCRTQVLRYLPGGIWAPTSRVALTEGSAVDRFATVAAENVIALCAALAVGGVGFAVAGRPVWLPLVVLAAAPVLAARRLRQATRLDARRVSRATANGLAGFACFAAAAVAVQVAVSGWHHPLLVAGAAGVSWAAGLVVVFAPGGIGVRELVYIALLESSFPHGELVTAAVVLRVVTIVAELLVLLVLGRPRSPAPAARFPGNPQAAGAEKTT